MTTTYGMSYILEEKGNLQDCTFTDINNRMFFRIRCTLRKADQIAYMIYDSEVLAGRGGTTTPVACLNFAANHAPGTVRIGQREYVEMDKYLVRTSRSDYIRRFTAADGNAYIWTRKFNSQDEIEWECTKADGSNYLVASSIAKSPSSSSSAFIVEEAYAQLAGEFLASFTIMRLIAP